MNKNDKKNSGLVDPSGAPVKTSAELANEKLKGRSSLELAEEREKKRQQKEEAAEPDPFDQVPEGFAIKLIPLGAQVLIKPAGVRKKTKSGIHVPDNAQEQLNYGMIVAVGPGDTMSPDDDMSTVEKGDTVMFSQHAGYNLNINGQMYLMMRISDCRCILKIVPKPQWEAEQPTQKIVDMESNPTSNEVAERHNMPAPQPDVIRQGTSIANQEGIG